MSNTAITIICQRLTLEQVLALPAELEDPAAFPRLNRPVHTPAPGRWSIRPTADGAAPAARWTDGLDIESPHSSVSLICFPRYLLIDTWMRYHNLIWYDDGSLLERYRPICRELADRLGAPAVLHVPFSAIPWDELGALELDLAGLTSFFAERSQCALDDFTRLMRFEA
ncbi:MAG TPA: hypothetical protein VFS21_11720 [Roseiflexaceae bacterium]|nr:hypothetical protein [Roseiflexaceae bacterium]